MKAGKKYKTVDEYFADLPAESKTMLKALRQTIKKAAPRAEELISYNIPAFKFHGLLVFYALQKKHIGFYPTASGIALFKKELIQYEIAKGTVRFPLDKPLPLALISKIVKYRVQENLHKAQLKLSRKN
jgi:uncharacterized protein YdhG (YjbR/CyaY superfamily)